MNARKVARICARCAVREGGKAARNVAAFRTGQCWVCGKIKDVTEPSHFQFPEEVSKTKAA